MESIRVVVIIATPDLIPYLSAYYAQSAIAIEDEYSVSIKIAESRDIYFYINNKHIRRYAILIVQIARLGKFSHIKYNKH